MPRFGDQWVVDRTMFEYVGGGSCACCGFAHFMPGGTAGIINAISDLETDAANAEVAALEYSPWPVELRDQIWADRLRLRHKLKLEMKHYRDFWTTHEESFRQWVYDQPIKVIKKIIQCPRSEITSIMGSKYNIHSAFAIVICAVVEQVANFHHTQLPLDGRGDIELDFEEELFFDRRGGFTMNIVQDNDDIGEKTINVEIMNILLRRLKSLGGPKLLDRAAKVVQFQQSKPKVRHDDDDDDDEEEEDDNDDDDGDPDDGGPTNTTPANDDVRKPTEENEKPGPSFRLDRRVVRLMIARFWADQLQKRYLNDMEQQQKNKKEEEEKNKNKEEEKKESDQQQT